MDEWMIGALAAGGVVIVSVAIGITAAWNVRGRRWVHRTPVSAWRTVRRAVVAVVGSTVLLIGLALLVLPGPGVLTVVAGLAILAAEFAWARALLNRARRAVPALARLGLRAHAEGEAPPPPTKPADGRVSGG